MSFLKCVFTQTLLQQCPCCHFHARSATALHLLVEMRFEVYPYFEKTFLLLLIFSLQLVIKMLIAPSDLCNPLFQSDRDRFPVASWIICHWFPVSSAREKRKLCSDFDGSCSVAKLALQYICFSYQSFTSGFTHLFLCLHIYEVSAGDYMQLSPIQLLCMSFFWAKVGPEPVSRQLKKVKTLKLATACWCLWPETCAAVLGFVAWSVRSCSVHV